MENLFETTLQMIRDSGLPLAQIAQNSGVGRRWIFDLMAGRYSDPGVNKIQRIHRYLSGLQSKKAA